MITAYGSEKIAVEAMKLGAADYVPKPFDNDELELVVERVLEGIALRRDLRAAPGAGGRRLPLREHHRQERRRCSACSTSIRKVADTRPDGADPRPERHRQGAGRERDPLQQPAPRRKPFVKVNCAAFSRELVESELFGHEKGAFTGAIATREGKFEIADGGTLFLDEIGDMPLETQAKILRVLQERELERVGGNRTIKVDVRVIAATNQDLEAKVQRAAASARTSTTA